MTTLVQRAKRMRRAYPDSYGLLSVGECVEAMRALESRRNRTDTYRIRRRKRYGNWDYALRRD